MRLLFCVTLSLIVGHFNVDSFAVDVIEKLIKKSNEDDQQTKFIDLNDDCVLLIFEHLNFAGLLNAAQMSDEFSTLAVDVFRHKYSRVQFVLVDNFPLPNNLTELLNVAGMRMDAGRIDSANKHFSSSFNDELNITETKYQVQIQNGDAILKTFKHFGHVIKRLETITQSRKRPLESELIGKLISKYSSESLVDIEIVLDADKLLDHITKPLINVENVIIRDNFMRFNPQSVRVVEIFPAVRRLDLGSLTDESFAHFGCHLSNLEHVHMVWSIQENKRFPDVVMKNPQIRSINLYGVDTEFVQMVNTQLPQLETLELAGFKQRINAIENESIQFENVTKFVIGHGFEYFNSPGKLHFPRLQTLQIDYNGHHFAKYVEFLNEHNKLTHLYLKNFEMNDSQFKQLTANLPKLVELSLRNWNYQSPRQAFNAIVEFLRSHDKVQQLNLLNFPKDCDELQQLMKHEWTATINGIDLIFKRK